MPVATDARTARVIEAIFDLFFSSCRWPEFVDLDRYLDRRGESDAETVLLSMPADLIFGVSRGRAPIRDDQQIALTVAALASCSQAQEDLPIFLAAVRHAADLEQALLPGDPPATLSSETIAEAIFLPAAGRSEVVARLGELLRVENWGWTSASSGNGQWSFTFDRRVRRLRSVMTAADYWSRMRGTTPNDDAVRPGSPAPVPDDELSIFISYSHADKPIARALAEELRAAGARVWIDEGELRAGDSIIDRIANAISDVHFVVALVSEKSVESRWCNRELGIALTQELDQKGVRLLPLRIGDVTMPTTLTGVFYRQLRPEDIGALARQLIEDAYSHEQDRSSTPPSREPPRSTSTVIVPRGSLQSPRGGQEDAWSDVIATGYGEEVMRQARRMGLTPADYVRQGLRRPGRGKGAGRDPGASPNS